MYKIEIQYTTRSSYGYEQSKYLDLEWSTLENAKKNLQYIKEHYRFYVQLYYHIDYKERPKFMQDYKDKEWIALDNNSILTSSIVLKADNGNSMRLHCFWLGQFENLQRATIIDDDLEFIP